jgi:hypothetical protein
MIQEIVVAGCLAAVVLVSCRRRMSGGDAVVFVHRSRL